MRVIRIKALAIDTLTPTLSLIRERGLLRHPPEEGEGTAEFSRLCKLISET